MTDETKPGEALRATDAEIEAFHALVYHPDTINVSQRLARQAADWLTAERLAAPVAGEGLDVALRNFREYRHVVGKTIHDLGGYKGLADNLGPLGDSIERALAANQPVAGVRGGDDDPDQYREYSRDVKVATHVRPIGAEIGAKPTWQDQELATQGEAPDSPVLGVKGPTSVEGEDQAGGGTGVSSAGGEASAKLA